VPLATWNQRIPLFPERADVITDAAAACAMAARNGRDASRRIAGVVCGCRIDFSHVTKFVGACD